jgi:uncharacterized protein YndB with AHSA1/START domain
MKTKYLFAALVFLGATQVAPQSTERAVTAETTVNASVAEVWKVWTTEEGIKSFFAPGCKIDLRVSGAYEMHFAPDAPVGQRGGDGNVILAIQPLKMLSFTWNAPPSLPNVRQQHTSVVLRFKDLGNNTTKITLAETGWGEGEEWDKAFEYFSHAWQDVVFKRLKYRFENGPVDWKK